MPWYFPWSDSIKKRACRYLLQHYLGHFLKEKLTLDQLSVNLYDGTGTIQDVLLDVLSLNKALETYNVPIEIVDGFVGSISVTIPWSALVNDSTMVEIRNLELTVQPKQRTDQPGVVTAVMLDSMFASMTTSMQLAQECLKQDASDADTAQPFEGLEMFAQTIEAVLTRIKVTFIDTIVRLEHLPREAKTGAALEIRINRVEYFDELAVEQHSGMDSPPDPNCKSVYEPAAIAHKNVHMMGVTMFCDEFLESQRTFSRTPSEACSPLSPRSCRSTSPDLPPGASIYHSTTQDIPTATGSASLPQSDPIKVAVLHGRQEIKLKVKQNEQLAGPKLEMDVTLGSVNVHLSPRQVHLLLEIANGLAVPGSCDDSNVQRKSTANKPMSDVDYERVEHELQRQLQYDRIGLAQERAARPYHWSDDIMTLQSLDDDHEEEDMYFDLNASQSGTSSMESSFASSIKSCSTPSTASTFVNYGPGYARRDLPFQSTIPQNANKVKSPHKKDLLPRLLDDPSAEVTRYRLRISFLSVVVLHEDPPASPTDGLYPASTLTQKLKVMSENYFSRALGISTTGMGTDLVKVREQFTEACPFDHLGFLGKPLILECNQKSTPVIQSLAVDLTMGLAEIVECVFDRRGTTHSHFGFSLPIENVLPDYCLLLTFVQDVPNAHHSPMFSSMSASAAPCVRLRVTSVEKTSQSSRRPSFVPKTEVHLELAHCKSEVDITIIDRIQALLSPQPLTKTNGNGGGSLFKSQHPSLNQARLASFNQVINENGGSDQRLDLRLSSPHIELSLRFPIPDLRNDPGLTKLPWWCRSLRKEQLLLDVTDADLHTTHTSQDMVSKMELIWKELQVLFQEDPHQEPICFGKITPDDTLGQENDDGFNWPRLTMAVFPELHSVLEEDPEEAEDTMPHDSLNGACQFIKPPPSPFSSRKAMYDNEELVMPGDREETREFVEKAVANTQLLIELSLPCVHAVLPSKEFFELLYNRFNNDLLLWEPLAPAPLAPPEPQQMPPPWGLDLATQLMHTGTGDRFMLCKSGIQYDSSSDSEEDESGQFYSLHEAKQRQRRKARQEQQNRQSKLCVNLNIGTGRLTAFAPLRDEENKVRTDKQGEFVLDLSDASMFTVVAHNGDPDLQYLCIHSNRATMYHAGSVDIPPTPPSLQYLPSTLPAYLIPTINLSDPGVITRLAGQVGRGPDSADMLSVALRIKVDTFRNVKEFQVALGVRGGTLRHRTPHSGESWFTQMLDFLAVTDQQILGYTWPKVVTELHCHLWSCGVDYRPLYLPLRAMLTVETFSISSNIIAESPTSLLRFIVEDAALYISEKCNEPTVDLQRNYLCVIDLGVFELSLRTSDGKDTKKDGDSAPVDCDSDDSTPASVERYPKLDLRASNNIVHVRTCSDTCCALSELIQYIADDGDSIQDSSDRDTASIVSQTAPPSEPSISGSPQLTQSHQEQVPDMMADAMRELAGSDSQSDSDGDVGTPTGGGPTEIFFFPDESDPASGISGAHSGVSPGHHPASAHATPSRQVMLTMSESDDSIICTAVEADDMPPDDDYVQHVPNDWYSVDEEFCIIDDPGLGIVPSDGEPKIRVLVKTPIIIIDNHFAQPLGKSDQLKAPEHFPPAVSRYTLREMSLVWYMYGGHDFTTRSKAKKYATLSQGANKKSSTTRLGRVGWQARGGPGRDINTLMELQLNKVRLQHEVFPETAEQASRQILLINEVELRDRLTSSKINKFLYQYTSETLPRQAHANMVVLKALHHRPDPILPAQECSLRVSLLPLRLNIDQDALFFLRTFFTTIGEESREASPAHGRDPSASPAKGKLTPAPVMSVGPPSSSPCPADQEALLIMFDEIEHRNEGDSDSDDELEEGEEDEVNKSQPIYFKSFVFSPDVPIRLDYHGKRVDMEHGTLAGLLVGLAQLNCSELRLKRINHRHGLLGLERLALYTLNEWLQDLKQNQLASILGGVGPMYSLVQLVQGIRDLFWLPVEQYQKDGRIVRGIQRGAHAFTTSTAMAALELTNRLVQTVQYAAEVAYDMVSPGPSVRTRRYYKRRRVTQPADLREGMSNAMTVVKDGFSGTASNIAKVALEEHELKGMTGAVGGVLRQIPPTIIQPIIIATEATSNVLGGMRNQLRPDRKREDEDKWKPEDS